MSPTALEFFFQQFAEEQMNFLYTGEFTDDHTDGFIQLNNHQYNAADEHKTLQRRSGFLIAECFQNIIRHNDSKHSDSYFQIKNNKGVFSIVSGNRIPNENVPKLEEQLEDLNKLDSDQLKDAYRTILNNGDYSDKGGAGLGLIEMARRSKNKLGFHFVPIDDKFSYFYFCLCLNTVDSKPVPITDKFVHTIDLRSKMQEEDLFFIYKGVITIQTTVVILGLIEKSFKSVNQRVLFVKFMGLFEKLAALELSGLLAQNPVLTIGERSGKYHVNASFYLDHSEGARIHRLVKTYNIYDSKALDNAYKQALNEGESKLHQNFTKDIIELLKSCKEFDILRTSVNSVTDRIDMKMVFVKKRSLRSRLTFSEA